jgi:hypothetical protein
MPCASCRIALLQEILRGTRRLRLLASAWVRWVCHHYGIEVSRYLPDVPMARSGRQRGMAMPTQPED